MVTDINQIEGSIWKKIGEHSERLSDIEIKNIIGNETKSLNLDLNQVEYLEGRITREYKVENNLPGIFECPFCGGEGRQYQKIFIKIIYPLLFLDPKYRCENCKEMFNEPRKADAPLLVKKRFTLKNVVLILIIAFFLWGMLSFLSTVAFSQ